MKIYLCVALGLLAACSDKTLPTAPPAPRVAPAPTSAPAEPRAAAGTLATNDSGNDATRKTPRAGTQVELRNAPGEKVFTDLSVK